METSKVYFTDFKATFPIVTVTPKMTYQLYLMSACLHLLIRSHWMSPALTR